MNNNNIVDAIHLMSIYPLLKRYFKYEIPKLSKDENEFVFEILNKLTYAECLYLEYCLNSHIPDLRNYGLLREALRINISNNRDLFLAQLKSLISMGNFKNTIEVVYDIGAGHDAWGKILKEVFPQASIILIDKAKILSTSFETFQIDIMKDIDHLNSGYRVLFFMSEFLHCKESNLEILKSPTIVNSHLIINELWDNPFIDFRLKQTGGKLISPSIFQKWQPMSMYKMLFDYYMVYKRNGQK